MLKHDVPYRDLASEHFDRLDRHGAAARLVRKLQTLGFEVAIEEPAA